jgi:non-lysosomal glucosylceramidase
VRSKKDQIPDVAWHRRMDAKVERQGKPSRSFTPRIFLQLLPLIVRLWMRGRKQKKAGFDPINLFNPPEPGPTMGVPLGGIGCGSITRGWRGDYRRWALRPGTYTYDVAYADQFSLSVQRPGKPTQAQVLYPDHPQKEQLAEWQWNMPPACATYHALFPRAWTTYTNPLPGISLTCRQISPVIAGNYKESSFPMVVFHWHVQNTGRDAARVGLMFTFQNGTGGANDLAGGHQNAPFKLKKQGSEIVGVSLKHQYCQKRVYPDGNPARNQEVFEDLLTFAIAGLAGPGVKLTYQARFDSSKDGKELWQDFSRDCVLQDTADQRPSAVGEPIAAALAGTVELAAGESAELVFSLAWDMPVVHSGLGTAYHRRYTLFYGNKGNAAPQMASDALLQYGAWEKKIEQWQKPILNDQRLPDWYRAALFNELYYIVDGGTIWATPAGQKVPDPDKDLGHFAYLEGHEYPMFNTYDVHFYASFALVMNWPLLEKSLQRDVAKATLTEYPDVVQMLFNGQPGRRKIRGMVPHDLGWPDEDFWKKVNGYFIHDVNEWKDLNPKFVLQVYRDFFLTRDRRFLLDCWPAVREAIEKAKRFDIDNDGMIENSSFPDQTYDTWSVSGASAYTGGLWLACLAAAMQIAKTVEDKKSYSQYMDWFKRGKAAYESKLWNGQFYDYDSSRSGHHNSIMADMLAGQWYARACGLQPVIDPHHIQPALKTIFDHNVMQFHNGEMGAVNGMRPNGEIDHTNMQSQEVWSGTSYGLAACLLQEGFEKECWQTAHGIVNMTYERMGYWFATPEAWDERGNYRSLAYMRPLCIWAIQWAWERKKSSKERREK